MKADIPENAMICIDFCDRNRCDNNTAAVGAEQYTLMSQLHTRLMNKCMAACQIKPPEKPPHNPQLFQYTESL